MGLMSATAVADSSLWWDMRPRGSVWFGLAIVVEDFFGRARREEGAYREYATDEQLRLGEKRPTGMVMNGETDSLGLQT